MVETSANSCFSPILSGVRTIQSSLGKIEGGRWRRRGLSDCCSFCKLYLGGPGHRLCPPTSNQPPNLFPLPILVGSQGPLIESREISPTQVLNITSSSSTFCYMRGLWGIWTLVALENTMMWYPGELYKSLTQQMHNCSCLLPTLVNVAGLGAPGFCSLGLSLYLRPLFSCWWQFRRALLNPKPHPGPAREDSKVFWTGDSKRQNIQNSGVWLWQG